MPEYPSIRGNKQPDLVLSNARLPGAGLADVSMRDGRIVAIDLRDGRIVAIDPVAGEHTEGDGAAAQHIDASGALLLPGLVDGHAHLDKTLWGEPWRPHQAGPSLVDRIEDERRVLRELGLSPQRQSTRLLRHMVARGTTHVRSHVDIDLELGLSHLHGLFATRDAHRDLIDMQLVAFPQTGVAGQLCALDLLDAAVQEGADAIGGIDPGADGSDASIQLSGIFGIAARRGCELDIHLHTLGEAGAHMIDLICDRTEALGLKGKVALGHAFCLGSLPPERLEPLLDRIGRLDIAIMTHAPVGYMPFPTVRLLAERGIRLFTGSDGVRDTWSPLNNGDMLERAYLIAYNSGFRDDAGLELAFAMASHWGAQVMGAADHGLAVGNPADLLLVDAKNIAEAVVMHPPRRMVIKRGQIVARDGKAIYPHLDPISNGETLAVS
jgi:cytosine/adenosine deaminase-related metal-dependent hydrolase